ncbi:hypothetical protein IFR05_011324 [Cadophora sp. M221]|nr:hypothetical protein IFR05_011324 [Cadophora sp. M221]
MWKGGLRQAPGSTSTIEVDREKADPEPGKSHAEVSAGGIHEQERPPKKPKTILEQDEELRLKLEGISGGGGGAGVEYEGGKAVGLKRGVRENMFRVI